MARANVSNTLVVPEETKVFPYYDDFNEDKNFHRILFRPGYAVQARELTQVQTILQNQIERFGRHIFVNGSSVIGGKVRFTDTTTLNLSPTYAATDIDVNQFKEKTIKYASGNNEVVARVIQVSTATSTEPPALHIKYVTGSEFGSGSEIRVDGENVFANLVSTANVKANGTLAVIDDSIFFYEGYFIKTPKQAVVAEKYSTQANCKIGLEFDDSIVTENSDTSLLDPALESSNYQAPGSARYKAELVLARRDLDSVDDQKFIELTRVEQGELRKNQKVPIYSEIEEVFARRTYDESGNYTVKPFRLALEESAIDSANNVQATLSEGKGYILGFEFETIAPTKIQVPRARTKANNTNYNLNMNYGNYVYVDDLMGVFPTTTMGVVDIHNVPYQYVNHASANAYNATKIGSTRVKDIEFFSGDTNVSERKFEFYVFDTNFTKLTGTSPSTANSTSQIVLNPTTASANDNAYVGSTIRITSGTSSGDVRTITSYNGATTRANVDTEFTTTPDATSVYSIEYDFGEAESFVINTVQTSGASANANTNIATLSKDNGLSNGNSFISEPSIASLVFPLADKYIVENSISDQTWNYRRVYTGVSFSSGVSSAISAGTNEGFEGASATSNVASTVTDNFLIVCTSGSRDVGEQIKANVSISGSPEQAIFDTANSSDSFTATIYAKMDVASTAAVQRTKTLVTANSQTFTGETAAATFVNSSGSTTSVYPDVGHIVIQSPSKRYDQRESLFLSNVVLVKKIYDLAGASVPSGGADLTGFTDVTSRFLFDDGQRDSFYDHASIRLRPGATPCVGPLVVCVRYYKTTSDSGYFSVDSYQPTTDFTEDGVSIGTGYSIIPSYKGRNLRDSIDFRPVRQNASNTTPNFTLGGVKVPIPATDFQFDYEYYLGRRDVIVATADKNLFRIEGIPAKYPQNPRLPSRSMATHVLNVTPYTAYPANVEVQFIENKRYTMRDIGNIDKRLKNVEYYVNLNTLEKNTLDRQITDVDGLDRTKYGIFTDGFTGHALGDYDSWDYRISTDVGGRWTGDGIATNEYAVKAVYMTPDKVNINDIAFGADMLTLSYTVEPAITQNTATKFTPVADLLFASFEGNIITVPEADIWREVERNIVINQINIVNEVNLRRFVDPGTARREQRLLEEGVSPLDILNEWARINSNGGLSTKSNLERNLRGLRKIGLNEGEEFFDLEALNNLNDLLN